MTRPTRPNLVLAVLFTGAFVMGCAEMLVVGMIDLMSADLAVSVPAAGTLVTANALGLAIGGPLLTFLTTRFDRRPLVLAATTVFVLANLLPALAADYGLFLAARVVIGAAQGLFIAAAFVTATAVVPPERAGRAMAVVITGFASASALGLPLGTLLGQAVGWRGSFAVVVVVGAPVLVVSAAVLLSVPSAPERGAAGQGRYAFRPRVVELAGPGAPLASSLPASTADVGIALGAFVGGLAIDVSGVPAAVLTGAAIAVGAVATAWATSVLQPPHVSATSRIPEGTFS